MSGSGSSWAPSPADIERYEQAIQRQLPGNNHSLDPLIFKHPILLGGLDGASCLLYPKGILRQKLIVAAALVECHPVSASWLLPQDRSAFRLLSESLRLFLRTAGKFLVTLPLLLSPGFLRRNAGI
jgi:hypothetical protein